MTLAHRNALLLIRPNPPLLFRRRRLGRRLPNSASTPNTPAPPPFHQPPHHRVEYRREDQPEERHAQHSEEHRRAQRLPHLGPRSEEHTSELQSRRDLVCRLLLEKKK